MTHGNDLRQEDYKIHMLTFKTKHGSEACVKYITDFVVPCQPLTNLHTANKHLLVESLTKLATEGDIAFMKTALKLWNKSSPSIIWLDPLGAFKQAHKHSEYSEKITCANI